MSTKLLQSNGPAQAKITNTDLKSVEDLIRMAEYIYERVRRSGVDPRDDKGNDNLYDDLRLEFRDFAMNYPIVFRWIVQVRQFSSKAFSQYLRKNISNKWDTREDYIRSQADYLVLLFKALNTHYKMSEVREYRKRITEKLLEEDKNFMESYKKAELELEQEEVELKAEREAELKASVENECRLKENNIEERKAKLREKLFNLLQENK